MRRLLCVAAALLPCAAAAAEWTPVPRRVVALYDPRLIPGAEKDTFFLDLHQHVELPLNHLGLVVDYLDLSRPLPEPSSLRGVAGAVAWFPAQAAFDDPRPVCRWLSGAMRAGVRVALVGQLGLYEKSKPGSLAPECAQALRALGVSAAGLVPVEPLTTKVAYASPLMGFERRPDPVDDSALPAVRALPGGRVQLRVEPGGGLGPVEPVIVTPRGGVALDPFFLYSDNSLEPHRKAWVVDPFAFFEAAFAVQGLPRPDPHTLSGRRLFMTRLDGDGFFNMSESDRRRTAGAVFFAEFIEAMPDTPFTAALIAGYYDLALYNDAEAVRLSRRVFARLNVEPAAHGYAHPLEWRTGKLALSIPRYAMDAVKETAGAARLLEELLLTSGRRVGLLQWTGDCRPDEAALAAAEDAGLLQMNGGGGRFDRAYPSVAHLFPLGRQVGSRRQIYAPASNENDYTELWSSRFYGYRDVIETFERSGAPRRLKPVDIYVHFYSAERYASLQALKQVYAWARAQPLIPVFGGRYARAARDFSRITIERRGPDRFRLRGGADLRTVRFDGVSGAPDLRRSRGVIGWRREGGSLYVALDHGPERELVMGAQAPGARLEEADFEVEGWKADGGGVAFEKRGWWDGYCVLAGLSPGRSYRVRAGSFDRVLKADARGRLEIRFGGSERGRPASRVRVSPV